MSREDIIRMAREAKLWPSDDWYKEYGITTPNEQFLPELERFAALVAAAEREACAKVCDELADRHGWEGSYANECAIAIRARGQE
jgi:hypothetical protein